MPEAPVSAAQAASSAAYNPAALIAATLHHNEFTYQEGFDAFDQDQDGKISLEDLVQSCTQLGLECGAEELKAFHESIRNSEGAVLLAEWRQALQNPEGLDDVLASRGIASKVTVSEMLDTIAAALQYNGLSLDAGFEAFDRDADGKISALDLETAVVELQLNIQKDDITRLYSKLDPENSGFVSKQQWDQLVGGAESSHVLKSRGVGVEAAASESAGTTALNTEDRIKSAMDTIAAALKYNGLSAEEGYQAFDIDEDSKVNMQDLRGAVATLQLDLKDDDVTAVYKHLDPENTGSISQDKWIEAVNGANAEDVLKSRGVNAGDEPAGVGSEGRSSAPASSGADTNTPVTLKDSINIVAAALEYNKLSHDEGYDAFDADEDGKVSQQDLSTAVSTLQLNLAPPEVEALFKHLDKQSQGVIEREDWKSALAGAETQEILKSRGVTGEENTGGTESVADSEPLGTAQTVSSAGFAGSIDTIAAALKFNNLSPEEGYEAFDVDMDSKVSLKDLQDAVQTLQLDLKAGDVSAVFSELSGDDGLISLDKWVAAINSANADDVLKSRGVTNAGEEPAGVGADGKSPEPVSTGSAPVSLKSSINIVAAALEYNKLSLDEGYDAFDADEDGKVSQQDLSTAVSTLQLNLEQPEVEALYKHLDKKSQGWIEREDWKSALAGAETQEILKSRGVTGEENTPGTGSESVAESERLGTDQTVSSAPGGVDASINTIAAALKFNDLSSEEGYEAFDVDEDDKVSWKDFQDAVATLQLDLKDADMKGVFEHLDPEKTGFISKEKWNDAIKGANADEVLKSLGVPSDQLGASPEKSKVAAEQQKADSASQSATVSKPPETETAEAAENAAPVEQPAEQAPPALERKGSATNNLSDLIGAFLAYNNLSPRRGYEVFDMDRDGVVNATDCWEAAQHFNLDVEEAEVKKWHSNLDKKSQGHIELEDWIKGIETANTAEVLQSRGVTLGEAGSEGGSSGVQSSNILESVGPTFINLIAAALKFNDLDPETGFNAFDQDDDGLISQSDMLETTKVLQLPATEADVLNFFTSTQTATPGFLKKEEWITALTGASGEEVDGILRSIGTGSKSDSTGTEKGEVTNQEAVDMVAAVLVYNGLTVEQGFDSFDIDDDGLLSLSDLQSSAIDHLKLELTVEQVKRLHSFLDKDGDSFISKAEWMEGLEGADAKTVLASRGLVQEEAKAKEEPSIDDPDQAAAAVKIQAIARGKHDRERVEALKKEKIDKQHKGLWKEPSFKQKKVPPVDLSKVPALHDDIAEEPHEHRDLPEHEVDKAVVKIQAAARGKADRERVDEMKKEKQQPKMVKSQPSFKTKAPAVDLTNVPKLHDEMPEDQHEEVDDLPDHDVDKAAVKIQAIARGKADRQKVDDIKKQKEEPKQQPGFWKTPSFKQKAPPVDLSTVPQLHDDLPEESHEFDDLPEHEVEKGVVKIQAVARGKADRQRVKAKKAEKARETSTTAPAAPSAVEEEENHNPPTTQPEGISEEKAAVKIQALQRGNSVRKKSKKRKHRKQQAPQEEVLDEGAKEGGEANPSGVADPAATGMTDEDAAIRIQTRARGMIARAEVKQIKKRRRRKPAVAKPANSAQPSASKVGTGKDKALLGGRKAGHVMAEKFDPSAGSQPFGADPLSGPNRYAESLYDAPAAAAKPAPPQFSEEMVAGLQAQLNDLGTKVADLNLQMSQLTDKNNELEARNKELEAKNKELQDTVEQAKNSQGPEQSAAAEKEVEELRQKLADLQAMLEAKNSEDTSMTEALAKSVESSIKGIESVQGELTQIKESKEELDSMLEKAFTDQGSEQLATAQKEAEELRQKCSDLEAKLEAQGAESKSLPEDAAAQNELEELRQRCQDLQTKLDAKQSTAEDSSTEDTQAAEEVIQAKKEIEALREKLQSTEQELAALKAAQAESLSPEAQSAKKQAVAALLEKAASSSDRLLQIENGLSKLQNDRNELTGRVKELVTVVSQSEAAADSSSEEIQSLRTKVQELEKQLQNVSPASDGEKANAEIVRSQVQQVESSVARMTELQRQVDQLQADKEKLDEKMKDALESLENASQPATANLSQFITQVSAGITSMQDIQSQLETLQTHKGILDNKMEEVLNQVEQSKVVDSAVESADLEKLKQQIAELEASKASEIKTRQGEVEKVKQELAEMEASKDSEIRTRQDEIENLKLEILDLKEKTSSQIPPQVVEQVNHVVENVSDLQQNLEAIQDLKGQLDTRLGEYAATSEAAKEASQAAPPADAVAPVADQEELKTKISSLQEKLTSEVQAKDQSTAELEKERSKVVQLEEELARAKKTEEEAAAKFKDLEEQLAIASSSAKAATETVSNSELEAEKAKIKTLEEKLASVEKDKQVAKEVLSEVRKQMESAKQFNEEATKHVEDLVKKADEELAKRKEAEEKLDTERVKASDLEAKINALTESNSMNDMLKDDIQAALDINQETQDMLFQATNRNESQSVQARAALADADRDVEEALALNSEAQNLVSQLSDQPPTPQIVPSEVPAVDPEELNAANKTIESLTDQLAALKSEHSGKVADLDGQLKDAKAQLADAQGQLRDAELNLNEANERLQRVQAEKQERAVQDLDEALALNSQASDLLSSLSESKAEADGAGTAAAELEAAKKTIEDLKTQLSGAQSQSDRKGVELDEALAQHKELLDKAVDECRQAKAAQEDTKSALQRLEAENEELKVKTSSSQAEVGAREQEIALKLTQAEEQLAGLQKEKEEASGLQQELERKLRAAEDELKDLQKDKEQGADVLAKLQASEAQIKVLQEEIAAKPATVEPVVDEQQLKDSQLKIKELEQQLEVSVSTQQQMTQQAEAAAQEMATWKDKMTAMEKNVKELETELDSNKAALASARDQVQASIASSHRPEEELVAARSEIQKLNSQLDQLQTKCSDLETKSGLLQTQVEDSRKAEADAREQAATMRGQLSGMEALSKQTTSPSNDQLDALRSELAELKVHLQAEKSQADIRRQEADSARQEANRAREELNHVRNELQQAEFNLRSANTDLDHNKAMKGQLELEVRSLKEKNMVLERQLSEKRSSGENDSSVEDLRQQVTDLSRNVTRLVEEGRALGEEGRKQREDLRKSEFARRELQDTIQTLEEENARIREEKSSAVTIADSARVQLESRYAECEQGRRDLSIEVMIVKKEREGLMAEVERLSKEVADSRVKLTSMGAALEAEKITSQGINSMPSSPAKDMSEATPGYQNLQRQLQLEMERSSQQEKIIDDLRSQLSVAAAKAGSSSSEATEIFSLREQLRNAQSEIRRLEDLNQKLEDECKKLRSMVENAGSGVTDGQAHSDIAKDLQERNMRVRALLKENAECHAQVRQLSAEVVGLTEALEMVTKRAQDKDSKHSELQTKMEKIVRLAGLVDPLLAMDARAGPALPKKKKRSKSNSKRNPSPGNRARELREMIGAANPPPMEPRGRPQAWGAQQEGPLPTVNGRTGLGQPVARPASASRQRPQSARARIEQMEEVYGAPQQGNMSGLDMDASDLSFSEGRREYLPANGNLNMSRGSAGGYEGRARPLSANASSDAAVPRPPAGHQGPPGGQAPWRPAGAIDPIAGARSVIAANGRPSPASPQGGAMAMESSLRPFSFLVKCVQDGSVSQGTPLRIIIEYCNSEHYSRRHDISRYQTLYDRVTMSLNEQLKGRRLTILPNNISTNPESAFEPRAGAFEVYVEWTGRDGGTHTVVLFSKLESMRYPNPSNVAARLRVVLSGGQDGGDGIFADSDFSMMP